MAVIWETVDRPGRPVELSDRGWNHILMQHEDMASLRDAIRDTVALADEITRDKDYIHYRKRGAGLSWIRVVVHYRPRNPAGWIGEVITAHVTSHRDPKEALRWSSTTLS